MNLLPQSDIHNLSNFKMCFPLALQTYLAFSPDGRKRKVLYQKQKINDSKENKSFNV